MKIIKATTDELLPALELLDRFRVACMDVMEPSQKHESSMARDLGQVMFIQVVNSGSGAVFMAEDNGKFIGIATIYLVPQIRHGNNYAEIEELFVASEYQGKGVAQELLKSLVEWAKSKDVTLVRLESDKALVRAHKFYEKEGFVKYGVAYRKTI